jgi:MFS transporter, UMF1 family
MSDSHSVASHNASTCDANGSHSPLAVDDCRDSSGISNTRDELSDPSNSHNINDLKANQSTTPQPTSPQSLPFWYPHFRGKPVYNGRIEVLGWALDAIGRAISFIGAGAFLGTALLQLAKEAAGCIENEEYDGFINETINKQWKNATSWSDNEEPCTGRVYGIRPSSILTTYTVVVSLFSASLLPLWGAILDYTPYRLQVGQLCSIFLCLLLFPQMFVNGNVWFMVAIMQMCVAFVGWAQTMVTYAYLPGLTESERQLQKYTQSFTMLSFTAMILYLLLVLSISSALGWGEDEVVQIAQLAMGVSFVVSSICLFLAWGCCMKPRPPAHEWPADHKFNLCTIGFVQVYRTIRYIAGNLPALKWFYISISFVDAGISSLATVAITYMTDTLEFSSIENGIAILLMLIGSLPGAYLSGLVSDKFNPLFSCQTGSVILFVNTILVASILHRPGQQLETYLLGFVWGCGWGWKWTLDRLVASVIIPVGEYSVGCVYVCTYISEVIMSCGSEHPNFSQLLSILSSGQDAELMGTYLFACQALSWLPPLVYTGMNEAGVNQQIAIGSLAIWFAIGIVAMHQIGDFKTAVITAGRGYLLKSPSNPTLTDQDKYNANSEHIQQHHKETQFSQPKTYKYDVSCTATGDHSDVECAKPLG